MLDFSDGSGSVQIRIDPTRISLTRGFDIHRLTVPVELTPTSVDPSGLTDYCDVDTDLSATGPQGRWIAASHQGRLPMINHQTRNVHLVFPVTNQQLLDIEEHRQGHDLQLELHIRGFLPYSFKAADSREMFRIPASTWQNELQNLGTSFGFALSIPLQGPSGARQEAAEYLQQARRLLYDGEPDKAIGSARQAMERTLAVADWPVITKADNLQERSQTQRWRAIYKAAFDQASGAEHADEITKDFEYSRTEAEALIGIAASLLRVVSTPGL
ncbi:hypothetical protein [Streptomyces hydrogenans]|uniref:hypothetical protein n=1 Tax=Streptomyces hydrogenans TaxID=1873719 RepID=UPI003414F678